MSPTDSLAEQKVLRRRLEDAHAAARAPLSREEVTEIVRELLVSLGGDMSALDMALYNELEGLARYIQHARREIAAIQPEDINTQHIPTATDELDAVVGATEQATFQIFDACDVVSGIAGSLDADNAAKLTDAVTRIYEACNFQDVTGQRITKVVKALKHIESKVDMLVTALGGGSIADGMIAESASPEDAPEILAVDPGSGVPMHGPALPGQGISQDDIDALLASFD